MHRVLIKTGVKRKRKYSVYNILQHVKNYKETV